MISTFELIEVSTEEIRKAYEPTKIQLDAMSEESAVLLAAQAKVKIEFAERMRKEWQKGLDAYYENRQSWDDYHESDTLYNRFRRKVKQKPIHILVHPGPLCNQRWYTEAWEAEHRPVNIVLSLLEECLSSLTPCIYSHAVQMNSEQLLRMDYFRRGEALEEAFKWLNELKEQS